MPTDSSSDSDDKPQSSSRVKLFGRKRPLHTVLGGGKVANVILWRNKHFSAAILAASTAIWFLFEIVEYHFLTLLCHLSITTMLAVFIWTNGATLLNRPPKIPETILSEAVIRDVALTFHSKLSAFMSILYDVACGKDLKLLLMTIASLWMLSVIGSYVSFLNLLYFGFVCIQTLPVLYERYEEEVDELAGRGTRDMMKLYRKFDSKVLDKIPRGPVKQKKSK
ncbi:reticulon-like protein B9 isoform X2 [Magnolia sinica]|uniref:reticulon-like protein B9 isoform X2 n=1 Tax=Magnolia sinica TaxID=86752 RepID=UPI0026588A06|nr:reticulon-like protein B9 isoform X2 [Magnolia sinica]